MTEALEQLRDAGVAVWQDDLSRGQLRSGELATLADQGRIVGVTTNPTIFETAIAKGSEYDDQLRDLALLGVTADEAARLVTTRDVRAACDVLADVHEATGGRDGRVSIEVDPRLARDASRTVAEARVLSWLVDRPNLFVKIPATEEGLEAITATLAEGISVNVTLIFSLERYEAVQDAFLAGLERAQDAGLDVATIHSVASFFVSRVDAEVDGRLDALDTPEAAELRGRVAIANARLAYARHERLLASERWQRLAALGANPQRPLWASTSVKDPAYDDTRYVIELVAPGTVNTMPASTMAAVEDHGEFRGDTVRGNYDDARSVLDRLGEVGVDLDDVTRVLEDEGVRKFADSWSGLLDVVQHALDDAAPRGGGSSD